MFYPLLVLFFLIGLMMGSFIHCLASRYHQGYKFGGRSQCFSCNQKISWYDNIPLLSWLCLRGRCRHCRQPIAVSHFLAELASGILYALCFSYLWFSSGGWLELGLYLVVSSLWLLIFLSDYSWMEIYLPPLMIGAGIILVLQLLLGVSMISLLLAMAIGALFFGLQYLVTRGKGIGSGDIYLGALMGLIFADWQLLLTALFLSYIIGAIFSLFLLARNRRNLKAKVPLGVFLALGTLLALFIGEPILSWYLTQLF